ncbi:Longin-like domain-containing protein [Podospora didyma]|uniref:Longin-like domain-containing protein n=1 Tax=Podospora didyma TaxID=330526 RepID=A0AAE0NGY5_9PEZI|nr:Longin-like domain-containing protein [Podospora didyma]
MATAIPSIACLGVIGRNNNPLHVALFPSFDPATNSFAPVRTPLQFSLLLSSTLDIFELRSRHNAANSVGLSGDFGLLHAVDERLAAYGFETNTGTKFVVIVDMRGRRIDGAVAAGLVDGRGAEKRIGAAAVGLREGEMKPVFKAMQTAYIKLLQNPFFDPDEHSPPAGLGGKKITNKKFADDMRRIGENWTPGVTNL